MPITIFKCKNDTSNQVDCDREIIKRLENLILEGQSYIITPTNGGALTIQKELVKKGALVGNRVMSLYEFTKRIAKPHPVILPNELRLLLLYEIMDELKHPAPTLQSVRPLMSIINAVKKNGLNPPNKNDVMFEIYSKYCERISSSEFIDDGDLTNIAIEKLSSREVSIPKAIGLIGFGRFDFAEKKIIKLINDNFPKTEILISHPYLPNEKSPINGDIERVCHPEAKLKHLDLKKPDLSSKVLVGDSSPSAQNDNLQRCKIKSVKLPNNSSEKRFISRLLSENKYETLITRQGKEGNPSLTNQLTQAGLKSLGHPHLTDTGWGRLNEILGKINKEDKTISMWLDEFISASNEIAKSDAKFANNELLETISKFSTWSGLILNKKQPKHIFTELLEMMSLKSASLTTLNSAYPFNWSLFEDGIYPTTPTILCNMTAGNFPKINSEHHPLATTWWSKTINRNFAEEDECLFNRLIHSVPEIVFSFSSFNSGGQENYKTPFFDLVESNPTEASSFPTIPESTFFSERLTLELQRRDDNAPDIFKGQIKSKEALDAIRDKLGKPIKLKVTSLESYANCPFAFFIRYILRAKELEDEGLALLPKDKGNIAHKILSQILNSETLKLGNNELNEYIDTTLDEIENELPEYLHKAIWKWERSVLRTWCKNVIDSAKDDNALPKGPADFVTEWPFGERTNNPLVFKLTSGESIELSGRVDRIDVSNDKSIFSIIDYKSGDATISKNDVLSGLHLQTPLYMDAVEKHLFPNATPAYGSIYSLKANNNKMTLAKKSFQKYFYSSRSQGKLEDEEFDDLRENIRKKVVEYTENILNGKFGFNENKCNKRCRLKAICRI